jgi:hypothetical protein
MRCLSNGARTIFRIEQDFDQRSESRNRIGAESSEDILRISRVVEHGASAPRERLSQDENFDRMWPAFEFFSPSPVGPRVNATVLEQEIDRDHPSARQG